VTAEGLTTLEKLLRQFPGSCRTSLHLEIPQRSETVLELPEEYKVAADETLLARIEQLFGERVAVFAIIPAAMPRTLPAAVIAASLLSFLLGLPTAEAAHRRVAVLRIEFQGEVPENGKVFLSQRLIEAWRPPTSRCSQGRWWRSW
jgi:hypothetical protein